MRSVLVLGALALLACWLAWHGDDSASNAGPSASPKQAEARYVLEAATVQRTDKNGDPSLRLTVAEARYFDDKAASLKTIDVEGLSGQAAPWKLHSDAGLVPAGESRLRLQAPVSGAGRFPDGQLAKVQAGAVWVDENEHSFSSDEAVTLIGTSREARAKGFTASFSGKKLKLNSVEMRYALPR